MSETKGQQICKRIGAMKAKRSQWESHWLDVANFFIPEYDDVFGAKTPGEKKRARIFESTGPHSLVLLASALHGMLTNPAAPWFGLSTGDDKVDSQDDVRQWLQDCALKINDVLNATNFQQEIHEVYLGLGSFGTATLAIEEDQERIVRFNSRPIYNSFIAENSKGLVDTVYREFKWTLRQIKQEFGEKSLPKQLRDSKSQDDEFDVVHAVYPRTDAVYESVAPTKMPFASCYVLKEKAHLLQESGFRELPYVVPRWMKVAGEIYGRSPAMVALPDTKMINEMMKTTIRGAQKMVDPPLLLPDEGIIMPFKATPSALNYYRAGTTDKIEPLKTDGRVDFGFQMMEDVRKRIREAFFIDQLQLDVGPQMTATEVQQRVDEKMRLLGPVLARQQFELLRPMIARVMAIMFRRGALPPNMPAVLQNKAVKVQYTSQIARAQRMSEMQTLARVIDLNGPLIEIDRTVLDNVAGDEYFRYTAKLGGLPQQLIRKEADVKKIRDNRLKLMEAELKNAQEMHDAETMGKAAPAMKAMMTGDKTA